MNFVSHSSYVHIGFAIFVFGIICLLTYITFSLSYFIAKKIGDNAISVIGKLMGLIIPIIGTSMIIEGIKISFDLVK